MGYKLNCGIELTECDPYDSFIYEGHQYRLLYLGGKTHFDIQGKRQYMICQYGKEWGISKLTPTEETKRKVAERQGKKEFNSNSWFFDGVLAAFLGPEQSGSASPEPLARIVDWRGGESHNPTDIIVSDSGEIALLARMAHNLGKGGWNTLIRINTSAIPKQRTMSKAEVEREFGVKVVD